MTNRKDNHVDIAIDKRPLGASDFDNVRIIYDSLVDLNSDEVCMQTQYAEINFDIPLYINAMTGGSRKTKLYNQQLARVAKRCNVAMAVGSMTSIFKDSNIIDSYTILREENPDGIIFANVSANTEVKCIKEVSKLIKADGIQLHLNVPQEVIMKEGDRNFRGIASNIKEVVQTISIPVIVKEVGFGMSAKTMNELVLCGVKTIDISGRGGTNFIEIEDIRDKHRFSYLYDFGQTTVESLIIAQDFKQQLDILASGGIRNPYDAIKCLCLGAKSVGIAGLVLRKLHDVGEDATVEYLNEFIEDMHRIMVMLGCKSLSQLQDKQILLKQEFFL